MKTILLVACSEFQRPTNQRVLAKAGYEVLTAGDGEEGLRTARSALPDLIGLDMLPKPAGLEVLQARRQPKQTCLLPVLVPGNLTQKNESKLLQEGATAYFEKSRLDRQDGSQPLLKMVQTKLESRNAGTGRRLPTRDI